MQQDESEVPDVSNIRDFVPNGRCTICQLTYDKKDFCSLLCGHVMCWWCIEKQYKTAPHGMTCGFCKAPVGMDARILEYFMKDRENPHIPPEIRLATFLTAIIEHIREENGKTMKNIPPNSNEQFKALLGQMDPHVWTHVKNKDASTAGHVAALLGNTEVLDTCHRHSAIVKNKIGSYPIHFAVTCKETLQWLLTHYPQHINHVNNNGTTPLMLVVRYGTVECTRALIQAGANINQPNAQSGVPPIILATAADSVECVRALLQAGADLRYRCPNNLDVVGAAVVHNSVQCMQFLIEQKMDIERDYNGYSALILAASMKHVEIAKMLIDAGANVNRISKEGKTALSLARSTCYTPMINLLIAAGAK